MEKNEYGTNVQQNRLWEFAGCNGWIECAPKLSVPLVYFMPVTTVADEIFYYSFIHLFIYLSIFFGENKASHIK